MQRSDGEGALAVKLAGGRSRIDRLHQRANAKIRIPKTHGDALEAVLINTSGGITGGDTLSWTVDAAANTAAIVTTQACERIYRSSGGVGRVTTSLTAGSGASLFWLPQETILFDGGALDRTLEVDLDATARFLALETVILGREAMGETVASGTLRDRWRIRRAGRLVHADDLRFDFADAAHAGDQAVLAGNRVFATLLSVTPDPAERRDLDLAAIRLLLPETGGASLTGEKIAVRLAAPSAYAMRKALLPLINVLLEGRALPKVWQL